MNVKGEVLLTTLQPSEDSSFTWVFRACGIHNESSNDGCLATVLPSNSAA